SLGHGANDAQKTMGVILALLIATKELPTDASVPLWVVLSAHTAIALGTLTGGWRIVKTMGTKLTRIQPVGGVCAETAAARALFFLGASVVCALLVLPTPDKYRWFAIFLAVVYAVLALASWLDNRSRNRETLDEDQPNRPVM